MFFLLPMEFRVFGFPAAGVEGPPKLEILPSPNVSSVPLSCNLIILCWLILSETFTVLGWNTPAVSLADWTLINVGCCEQISTTALIKVARSSWSSGRRRSQAAGLLFPPFSFNWTCLIYTSAYFIFGVRGTSSPLLWCESASVSVGLLWLIFN